MKLTWRIVVGTVAALVMVALTWLWATGAPAADGTFIGLA